MSLLERLLGRGAPEQQAGATGAACESCPLTTLPVGQPACLVCVQVNHRQRRRLAELGLTPGATLRVLQNKGGPLLVSVRDSRLALGRGMAALIDVAPLADQAASGSGAGDG
ncbi:MAG: FeoA family protein [Candidatus Promineifilaceae bacterium]|nr:FeoA family protein [Candidatus Promineifilaceae bacterium]